jgi:hypothetical protein
MTKVRGSNLVPALNDGGVHAVRPDRALGCPVFAAADVQ